MEMATVIFEGIGKKLADPDDTDLFQPLVSDFSFGTKSIPMGNVCPEGNTFSFTSNKEFAALSINSVKGEFQYEGPLDASSTWQDPYEKTLKIYLELDLSMGKSHLRKLHKLYKFSKPCKVQSLALPVLSKFTFFLQQPEESSDPPSESNSKSGYNCLANSLQGSTIAPGDDEVNAPIVLDNWGTIFNTKDDLAKSGYVYFGGGKEVQLHMTAGTEHFQFHNAEPPKMSEGRLEFTPPSNFPTSVTFKDADGNSVQGKLKVKGLKYGFYRRDENNPDNDINHNNSLEKYFHSLDGRTKRSSSLHLFGDSSTSPSPTVVVGSASRVFAVMTAIVAETDKGKALFGGSFLQAPAAQSSSNGTTDFFESLRGSNPGAITLEGTSYTLESKKDLKDLFGDKATYEQYNSRLIVEPINLTYDSLVNPDAAKEPPDPVFKDKFGSNFIDEKAFKMTSGSSATENTIDLTLLSSSSCLLTDRVSFSVKDQSEFDENFFDKTSKKLNLKGNVIFVEEGPLELMANSVVENSGIIFVKGDVIFDGGVKCSGGTTGKVLFTVVSVGGNIELKGTNEEIQGYLVALDGKVLPQNTSKVKITGGLAVKQLVPKEWKGGAKITYDRRFDITQTDRLAYYTVNIADYFDYWDMEML